MENDTANATARYEDPLQTTLPGRLLQLCWLVPSLVLILGLNCLFLVAILRTKKLWRPRFVLPASLCVLDIIQGSLFIPSSVVNIVMGGNSNPVWFCWTQASYFYVASCCTLSTLTLMAWDRYQAVCNALHYREQISLTRLLLSTRGNSEKRYYIIWVVCELTCIAVICLSYCKVYLETKKYQRRQRQFVAHRRSYNSQTSQGNKRTERTISAQITVLFVFLIFRYIQIGISLIAASEDQRLSVLIVKRTSQFMYLTVTCFSNPVIYGLGSKELQIAVRKICCGKPDVKSPMTRRGDVVEMSRSRGAQQDSGFASQCVGTVHTTELPPPSFLRLSTMSIDTCEGLPERKGLVSVAKEDEQVRGENNVAFEHITSSL
ncbi:Src y 2 domains-containing protein [Branchiostoma belcheri]|nr:Src y 2 domains-containing protein [Branchiostoma belcheri]